MNLFAHLTKFTCPMPRQEAMDRVQNTLKEDRAIRLSPIRATENELSFSVKPDLFPGHNSFCPDVNIRFNDSETGTDAQVMSSVKKPTRIIFLVFAFLLAAIEILLLCWYFRSALENNIVLLIPVIMLVFSFVMTFIGLRRSSRDVLYLIRTALQPDAISE